MSHPTSQHIWVLASPPAATISKANFKLETRPLPALKDGELLVRVTYLSNDPVMRLIQSHMPPGAPVGVSSAIATVLQSASDKYKEGDKVTGAFGWYDVGVVPAASVTGKAIELKDKPYASLSVLGTTALTAYQGIFDELKVTANDVVVVGGASGAVGSMAVQFAKKIVGARKVVGVAGSADKVAWVKSIGADAAVDYKAATFVQDLQKATEGKVSKFLDLTGGIVLDATIKAMAFGGHIAVAGNFGAFDGEPQKISEPLMIATKGLTITGFSVTRYKERGPALTKMAEWINAGKIAIADAEAIDKVSIDNVPDVYLKLFAGGKPPGKLITEIA